MRRQILALTLAAFAAAFSQAARAQSPDAAVLGQFQDWSVLERVVDGEPVCFALTEASDKAPKSVRHGDVYFLVSTWRSGVASEQPSLFVGYPLRPDATPTVRIGSDRFDMFPDQSEAFIEARRDEQNLIRAMRAGSTMRVEAVSARGTRTAYQFSLSGVSAALNRMAQTCG
ncbi:MAG: invasion associated locus B family protein [Maricaulaceae bacterium]